MNKKLAIGLLLLIVALIAVPGVSAYSSTGWLDQHPTSNPTPEVCGSCHPSRAPSCTQCHSNPFTLTINANPTTVTAGTPTSVTFTVTRKNSAQAVSAATVTLTGAATGSGTTSSFGTAAISVNANAASAGSITATASMTGYNSGTTTVTANAITPPTGTVTVKFMITDSNGLPVHDAEVSMNRRSIKTNDAGIAAFTNVALGTYSYEVDMDGYKEIEGRITVAGDTTVTLKLVKEGRHEEDHHEEEHHRSRSTSRSDD